MKRSKDKILIFGNGQIGNFYLNYFDNKSDHTAVITSTDVTDIKAVKNVVKKEEPTVIINTASKTNLEWIKENRLEAFNVNVLGANNVAEVCSDKDIYYIFLSSGCIFESKDEEDIKTEDSKPSPQAFYSWTKVWAEQIIPWQKSSSFRYLVLRPRQPISSQVSDKNMLIKLLTFTRFVDTPNTGTVIEDLMYWTEELMEERIKGTVHVANEGWSTPYKIALLLKKHVLPELEVDIMTKEELDAITPVKRVDTILDVSKLKSIVGEEKVKSYEDRLEDVIIKLGQNIKEAEKEEVEKVMLKTMDHTKKRAVPNDVWPLLYSRS